MQKYLLIHGLGSDSQVPLLQAEELIQAHNPDTVIFREYMFNLQDILCALDSIGNIAQQNRCAILMAPKDTVQVKKQLSAEEIKRLSEQRALYQKVGLLEYSTLQEAYTEGFIYETVDREWSDAQRLLSERGFVIEPISRPADFRDDAVGLWFGQDGSRYAFAKDGKNPVHRIPGTRTGVSICYELSRLCPEHLEGIDTLLIPAREGDDNFMKDRSLLQAGRATMTDLLKEYATDINGQRTEEVLRERIANSHYVKHIKSELAKKGIAAVRCDGDLSSGAQFLPDDCTITQLDYQREYCVIGFDKSAHQCSHSLPCDP